MRVIFKDFEVELTVAEYLQLNQLEQKLTHAKFVELGKSILREKRGRPRKK